VHNCEDVAVTDQSNFDDRGVFVFSENCADVEFLRSAAESGVERVDLDSGEYDGFFTADGERLRPRPGNEWNVVFEPTGEFDLESLRGLLRRAHDRGLFKSDPNEPTLVAREMLAWQWAHRWPRWPHWLDRRLHGDGPGRF